MVASSWPFPLPAEIEFMFENLYLTWFLPRMPLGLTWRGIKQLPLSHWGGERGQSVRTDVVFPDPLKVDGAPVQGPGFPWNFLVAHVMRTPQRGFVLWKGSCFRKIELIKFLGVEMFVYRKILPKYIKSNNPEN